MKANRAQIERALDGAGAEHRLYLLYGPDESSSRDLASRLARALGTEAERIDLDGATLKSDPARLADEAASISLFGGRRFLRVEPAGDESVEAVEALLSATAAGNPVVMIAGTLRKDSKLVKLALAHPAILAFASYAPEGGDADRLATAMARDAGLRVRPDVARRLASATGGDRALLAREIDKLALYLDAAPDRPRDLDHEALDALGAAIEEGDLSRLVEAVMGGDPAAADAELARLGGEGIEGIPILRALLRRLHLLAPLRAGRRQQRLRSHGLSGQIAVLEGKGRGGTRTLALVARSARHRRRAHRRGRAAGEVERVSRQCRDRGGASGRGEGGCAEALTRRA
jgi:DNA polymerase-3 subunit delta